MICSAGDEIARNIAQVAKTVYIAARSFPYDDIPEALSNMHKLPWIESLQKDGSVLLTDGQTVQPDSIIYCTGYKYAYPFLDKANLISTGMHTTVTVTTEGVCTGTTCLELVTVCSCPPKQQLRAGLCKEQQGVK